MNNTTHARLSLARSLGVCLVILTLAGAGVWLIRSCARETRQAVNDTIGNIKEAFVEVLQLTPRISVNNQVIVNQTSPIAELAVVSKEFLCQTRYTHTWLRSEKSIDLKATFRIKAGFDLREPVQVTIQGRPPKAHVLLPQPKILSCEVISEGIVDRSSGAWNWLGPEDHQAALEKITKEARKQADRSSLGDDAKAEIERKLRGLLGDRIASITFAPAPMNLQPGRAE